jgi:Bardet-Biedl syndrome 4 protein
VAGKQRYVASIACLKRALYLDPFEWIISYNLGLVHLNTAQYASAFHYLSCSINLKADFPSSYMYLAICLARLEDLDNSFSAYDKAISMEADHLFHLNYAITAYNAKLIDKAKEQFNAFKTVWNELEEEVKNSDNDILEQMQLLDKALQ